MVALKRVHPTLHTFTPGNPPAPPGTRQPCALSLMVTTLAERSPPMRPRLFEVSLVTVCGLVVVLALVQGWGSQEVGAAAKSESQVSNTVRTFSGLAPAPNSHWAKQPPERQRCW